MKKAFLIVCLLCLIGTNYSRAASRLSADKHQFIAIYGGVGAHGMLTNASEMHPKLGVAPSLGIGYRYFRNGFIVHVGLEGEYTQNKVKINDQQLIISTTDSEADPFLLHASFTQGKDLIRSANIFVPVLIGVEHRQFYGMVGAKVGMCVYGTTEANTLVSTQGEYERYINYFAQMPNHNLEDNVPLQSQSQRFSWATPSLELHLELGARLDHPTDQFTKHPYRLYLGVFANYGVLNINPNTNLGNRISYSKDQQGVTRLAILPSMVSAQMLNQRVNPLTVGIKFTYLIELPTRKICVTCRE